jgi:hypothetical protein
VLHPQVHCLVTGGGLTAAGEWRVVRNGFLLPVRVVMAVFRGKLRPAIARGMRGGQLTLPVGMAIWPWANRRHKLGRQQGHVHSRERYPHGEGGRTYVAWYIRGGPLANTQVVACAPGPVRFWSRINGAGASHGRRGLITVSSAEFLRRDLRHVPDPGTRVVRSDGLSAPTTRAALARCRAQVGQGPVVPPPVLAWQTAGQDRGDDHPERCPVCGRRLLPRGIILPPSRPPPAGRAGEAVA